MTTTDVLWRLAESYGELLGLGLGSVVIMLVVMTIMWHREIRWREALLGLGGMVLIGWSLWIIHDLDLVNRRTLQPQIDERLRTLFRTVNHHHRILSGSVCQPKADGKAPAEEVQALGAEAYRISGLVGQVKEELGSLLPSYHKDDERSR